MNWIQNSAALKVIEAAKQARDECDSLEQGEEWWKNLNAALDEFEELP